MSIVQSSRALLVGVSIALASAPALAGSPFGEAKRVTLAPATMKEVTGQGFQADYYGQIGYDRLIDAEYYAYWGLYYDSFADEDYYYWNAYKQAKKAMNKLYKAWYWAGQ
jgi:hypothetical protein